MSSIHIVTDSSAHFTNPHFIQQQPVTVVPNKISIAGKHYTDGVDLDTETGLKLIAHQPYAPLVHSPTAADYVEIYTRLARTHDAIISIHPSREIFPSWENARTAARQLAGHCLIEVIDSQNISAAQGMLVRLALRLMERGESAEEIVRLVRGAVDRLYSIYYVESISYLLQNKILSASHGVLGTMLGIKPLLTIETGHIQLIEKVRTRAQAVERLVEFVVEFTDIEDIVILQNKSYMTEQTRMLQDRLSVEFPSRHFPYMLYGSSLAAMIGVDATGVVVLESEVEDNQDDF
jgi:DegV family protein with EDD domain